MILCTAVRPTPHLSKVKGAHRLRPIMSCSQGRKHIPWSSQDLPGGSTCLAKPKGLDTWLATSTGVEGRVEVGPSRMEPRELTVRAVLCR